MALVVSQINLNQITLSGGSLGKAGNLLLSLKYQMQPNLLLNITPNDWAKLVYKMRGNYTDPALKICGGTGTEKPYEELKCVFKPSEDVVAFLKKLEERVKECLSSFMKRVEWNSCITDDSLLKANVVLLAPKESQLTAFGVKFQDGQKISGSGVSFLKPLLDDKQNKEFRGSDAKLVVLIDRLWTKGNKAGLSLKVAALGLSLPDPEVEIIPSIDEMMPCWDD